MSRRRNSRRQLRRHRHNRWERDWRRRGFWTMASYKSHPPNNRNFIGDGR